MNRLHTPLRSLCIPVLLALAGCATAPVSSLLDRIPPPPKDAAAAEARCGKHDDLAQDALMTEVADYQRRENSQLFQLMNAAHDDPSIANDYAKRHPEAAQALVDRQSAITDEARQLSQRMDQQARGAVRGLNAALDGIDGVERSALAKCLRVQQGGEWVPEPACAAPAQADAQTARVAAANHYLDAAQGVWQSWHADAVKTIVPWAELPAGTPEPDSSYVQMALAGYRQTQELMVRQLMSGSNNLCGLAVAAVTRTDPKP